MEKAVISERAKGTSWEVIGEILGGVSKSAAQKRWGTVVAQWRESADVDPGKLPAYVPDDLAEFSTAYDELDEAWKQATKIVDRQPLLADLNNATAALSGSLGVHSSTGDQQNTHYFPVIRYCAQEPGAHQNDELVSLWEVATRVREAQDLDVLLARRGYAPDAIWARDTQAAGSELVRGAQDHADRERQAGDAHPTRDAQDPDNPEDADRRLARPLSWAASSKYRRDYSREARRRNVARAYAEFQRQGPTLEERVTRLERAFEAILTDEPVEP